MALSVLGGAWHTFLHYERQQNCMSVLYNDSDPNVVEYHHEYVFSDLSK